MFELSKGAAVLLCLAVTGCLAALLCWILLFLSPKWKVKRLRRFRQYRDPVQQEVEETLLLALVPGSRKKTACRLQAILEKYRDDLSPEQKKELEQEIKKYQS